MTTATTIFISFVWAAAAVTLLMRIKTLRRQIAETTDSVPSVHSDERSDEDSDAEYYHPTAQRIPFDRKNWKAGASHSVPREIKEYIDHLEDCYRNCRKVKEFDCQKLERQLMANPTQSVAQQYANKFLAALNIPETVSVNIIFYDDNDVKAIVTEKTAANAIAENGANDQKLAGFISLRSVPMLPAEIFINSNLIPESRLAYTILHECSHLLRYLKGMEADNLGQEEILTDLTAIYLSGMLPGREISDPEQRFGPAKYMSSAYISPELQGYALERRRQLCWNAGVQRVYEQCEGTRAVDLRRSPPGVSR